MIPVCLLPLRISIFESIVHVRVYVAHISDDFASQRVKLIVLQICRSGQRITHYYMYVLSEGEMDTAYTSACLGNCFALYSTSCGGAMACRHSCNS